MNAFKFIFSILLLLMLIGCEKEVTKEYLINNVNEFHENYNNEKFNINYEILKKSIAMSGSVNDYIESYKNVKSKLGSFEKMNLLNINFDQKTSDGRDLIRLSFDSTYKYGVAKEFFYFLKSGEMYRSEIYSDTLLSK